MTRRGRGSDELERERESHGNSSELSHWKKWLSNSWEENEKEEKEEGEESP